MPRRDNSDADSRTNSVAGKRSAQNTSKDAKKRVRRNRKEGKSNARDLLTTGSSFSILADHTKFPDEAVENTMSSKTSTASNLGRNRLAAGFARPAAAFDGPSEVTASSVGESMDSAIEISDDEDMEDSEGGMVLNLQDGRPSGPVVLSSEDDNNDDDVESGEYSSAADDPTATDSHTSIPHQEHPSSNQRLSDLNNEELEDQILYAFYYLERDQIDLNRPVICLECLAEGHLSKNCHATPNSRNFCSRVKPGFQVKLWISCCVCASKEHLVGDCPHTNYKAAERWSLASLDTQQIINLSLDNSTRTLETEAENRGLRPSGLQIKGRAARHQANRITKFDTESSEEEFLPTHRSDRRDMPPRPGKSNAPSGMSIRKGGPGRDGFYATDSFGHHRVRPRSPTESREVFPRGGGPQRPNGLPSRAAGGGIDRWEPPSRHGNILPASSRLAADPAIRTPPLSSNTPTSTDSIPRPNIRIPLPNRKRPNPFEKPKPTNEEIMDVSTIVTRSAMTNPTLCSAPSRRRRRHRDKESSSRAQNH